MAKVKIIACDGEHEGELRPAVGRVGVQLADQPVQWKDCCAACLPEGFGGEVKVSMNGHKAIERTSTRILKKDFPMVTENVLRALKKTGPVTAVDLGKVVGLSKAVTLRVLHAAGKQVKRTGERVTTRWEVRK